MSQYTLIWFFVSYRWAEGNCGIIALDRKQYKVTYAFFITTENVSGSCSNNSNTSVAHLQTRFLFSFTMNFTQMHCFASETNNNICFLGIRSRGLIFTIFFRSKYYIIVIFEMSVLENLFSRTLLATNKATKNLRRFREKN